jgi:uncharacterized protein YwqG
MWEEELGEVARRRAALDWGAAVAEARARVVRWRAVDGVVADFYKPLPLVAKGGRRGDWLAEGAEPHGHPEAVGLDAHDRPVLAVGDRGAAWEAPRTIWRYDDGGFDEIDQRTFLRATVEDGRVVRTADAESDATHAGVITWDGDHAVRYDCVEPWRDRDVWRADIWDLEFDANGRPTRLRYAWDTATPTGFDAALAHAHALAPTTLHWDGRIALPEPWPDDPDALVEPLAQALDAALRAAVAAAPVDAPFCLRVLNGGGDPIPPFPPVGIVASAAFRDRMRDASGHDGEALEAMRLREGDGVATLELTELLDADALRACRVLSTALTSSDWPRNRAAALVADALGDRLSALLNAAPPLGAAEPFAALVDVGDPYGDGHEPLARLRATTGARRAAAFAASVASTRAPVGEDDAHALAERALTDRDALRALLAAQGLEDHADRLADEEARDALLLVPAEPGTAPRSRLGGPCLVAPGAPWPLGVDARPLSFLAALDLAELDVRRALPLLPAAGTLLFYADLEGDAYGDLANVPESGVLVTYLEPGVTPAPATLPPGTAAHPKDATLNERPVTAVLRLTLPDGVGAGAELGLDAFEETGYEEALEALRRASGPIAGDDYPVIEPQHWVGGLVTGVQGHPPAADTVLLLHLSWDPPLNFMWADGGAFQFRIDAGRLATREWSRIVFEADCG